MAGNLLDLDDMLTAWELALRAEHKSRGTVKNYGDAVRAYLKWCESTGTAREITKVKVQAFVVDLIDNGAQSATVIARFKGVRLFNRWLVAEGELPEDVLLGVKTPKSDRKVVNAPTEDQIELLLKACSGPNLMDKRDEAIVRFMNETGARASEVAALQVSDIDFDKEVAIIRRGKGGKGRTVYVGPQTALAINRYLRARKRAGQPSGGALWLAVRGKTFGYSGLYEMLKSRSRAAGLDGFHAHLMRHGFATRWLARGGGEGALMAAGGWSNRAMLDRYAGADASNRALAEAKRLALGDV